VKIVQSLKTLSGHFAVFKLFHPMIPNPSFTSLAFTDCLSVDQEKPTQSGGEGIAGMPLLCSLPGIAFMS
jgi:hypothetical protein